MPWRLLYGKKFKNIVIIKYIPTTTPVIIVGAGLSGLTLATMLVQHPAFRGQQILLLDRDTKAHNDRTWSFWATEEEPLPPVIYKSWKHFDFYSPIHSQRLAAAPYQYNMVRGIDFYNWAKKELAQYPNVVWQQATVTRIDAASGTVYTDDGASFVGEWVFNSAFTPFQLLPDPVSGMYEHRPFSVSGMPVPKSNIYLLQHFKGWIIETPKPAFDADAVTFMDFRVKQHDDTRFCYVLPLTANKALVEFTVFSPALLAQEAYDLELQQYIASFLKIEEYTITTSEFGVIPMTDYHFPAAPDGRLIHIGTAGGFVKGSSGYAFKRTQRKIRQLVEDWAETGHPDPKSMQSKRRFEVYDSIFLRALSDNLVPNATVFGTFFKTLRGDQVLRFLDEDTNMIQDVRALSSVPILPFTKAALRQIIKKWHFA